MKPAEHGTTCAFALREFRRAGIGDLVEDLLSGQIPAPCDIGRLAVLGLPALGRLIELLRPCPIQIPPLVQPLYYLPLAKMIEDKGAAAALLEAQESLAGIKISGSVAPPIFLAVDRWKGRFRLARLLEILGDLCSRPRAGITFVPLGPSTSEIRGLLGTDAALFAKTELTPNFFADLRSAGITAVEGGGDLEIHRQAAENGLKIAFSQKVPGLSSFDDSQTKHAEPWIEDFLSRLASVRDLLLPTENLLTWFPTSSVPLDRAGDKGSGPLGLQLFKAIVFGRLLLPEVRYVRAPLYLLGPKASTLTLSLGANDLGYAAVDSRSAGELGLPRLSEASGIAQAHMRVLARMQFSGDNCATSPGEPS